MQPPQKTLHISITRANNESGNTQAANPRQTFPLLHKGQRKNPENPHQIPSNHFFLIPNTSSPYTARSASFQRLINSSH